MRSDGEEWWIACCRMGVDILLCCISLTDFRPFDRLEF